MSKLEEREARRKQSIVGSMITEGQEVDKEDKPAAEPKKGTKKKAQAADTVQRSYYLEKDIDKALRAKAMCEEINLTQAINEALRVGLSSYLGMVNEIKADGK